jgi:uncharacterized protein (TIGR02118 family)
MVKLIVFAKRKQGMSVDEFRRYWLDEHTQLARQLEGVERYVANPSDLSGYRDGREPAFDAVVEICFSD